MSHTCHAHDCSRSVPPRMLMCRKHWGALPKSVQKAIWREYTPGQETTKRPNARYMAVQRYAVGLTTHNPNDEAAALKAARGYVAEAAVWRERALKQGLGDPLAEFLQESVSP